MRKLFSIVAAALLTLTANATILNIAPDSPQASDNIRREIRDHIQAGDTLMLADGVYTEADVVELSKDVVIMAAEGAKPIVKQQYYMKMLNSAKVTIIGVKFDGSLYPASDHCIRPYDATEGKTLTLIDCEFTNYPNGYIVYPQKADRCMQTLTIKNCLFENFGRSAIYVETGSSTLPLAEANIENSTFMATTPDSHRVIDIKNDGSEVADAKLRIDHCTFYNCNTVRSEKSTDVIVSNSIFAAPEGATYAATTFYAGAAINNCLTFNVAHTDGPTVTAPVDADPLFVNAAEGNLNLGEGSPALTAAADGGAIGDPRWVPAVAPAHTYTVAGSSAELFGTAWKPELADNDMVLQEDGTYKWEKTDLTLAAGTIEFKVCEDHAWTNSWPAQNYQLSIAESGIYTISIYYNPNDNNYVGALATKTGEAVVIPTVAMHGNFLGSWADTENFAVAEGDATASLILNLAVGNYEFGMRIGGSGNWTANGAAFSRENNSAVIEASQGNLTLAADIEGDYIFTWTFETNTLTITFPSQGGDETAIDNTAIDAQIIKTIENGQLIIIKNGVKFNAQGAVVR